MVKCKLSGLKSHLYLINKYDKTVQPMTIVLY